jgi:hypothetical protein
MKKRILLSLVSFFAMTAMWASLVDAYQIYVTAGAAGKTGATAELTLNMKNKNAISMWTCVLALPEGVTFVDGSATIVSARYPEGYNAVIEAVPGNDNSVKFTCYGEAGATLTGTDGAVATFQVKIAASVEPGDYKVVVVNNKTQLEEPNTTIHTDTKDREFTWTIEQGEEPQFETGDVNGDGKIDISDAVTVLNAMAGSEVPGNPDVNGDGKLDIADFVKVLNLMAEQN